jgi:hypothetical protein
LREVAPLKKGSQRGLGGFPHERLAWVRGDLKMPKVTANHLFIQPLREAIRISNWHH